MLVLTVKVFMKFALLLSLGEAFRNALHMALLLWGISDVSVLLRVLF